MPINRLGEIPSSVKDPVTRRRMQDMRKQQQQVFASVTPPRQVTNMRVTPKAGGNIVDFTRSDGTRYFVYWGTTAAFGSAKLIDIGINNRFEHDYGEAAKTLYYWVVAEKASVGSSQPVGPKVGVTLAMGTSVTPPPPPPDSDTPVEDDTSDQPAWKFGPIRS